MSVVIEHPSTIEAKLTCKARHPNGAELCNWRYLSPAAERLFNIREFEYFGSDPAGPRQIRYFLEEYRPNRRVSVPNSKKGFAYRWSPVVTALAAASPNKFATAVSNIGIDRRYVVRFGGRLDVHSIYYESIRECVDTIHHALVTDRWYQHSTLQQTTNPLIWTSVYARSKSDTGWNNHAPD